MPTTPLKKKPKPAHSFVTDVLLPSLFSRKAGHLHHRPIFPQLSTGELCLTWIGHASFLIQTPQHNILVDPNWANWLLVIRRLRHAGFPIQHLPNIDLVLITHAHFDHLNRRSLRAVAARQPIVVPEGVSDLVHNLGFEKVQEMTWWDEFTWRGLTITFTPAKHWGARVLHDRHRGYGGFVIAYKGRSIYHCGDTAYFSEFKTIGKKLHPEIVLMPIGAYDNPSGRDVHIGPEQAVQAFLDLKAQLMIPMHFGTYRMSYEAPHEPAHRLLRAAAAKGVLKDMKFLVEGMPQVF
jgi:L-ascorbate metabolism protein UlaG (beta-lactamase superfamily)